MLAMVHVMKMACTWRVYTSDTHDVEKRRAVPLS